MLMGYRALTDDVNDLINRNAAIKISDIRFVEDELRDNEASPVRCRMLDGKRYYLGRHDILEKKRKVINDSGELEVVENLENNITIDNQYRKMVIQKTNYLCGNPITFRCDNENYSELIKVNLLSKNFHKKLKKITTEALNCYVAFLYVFINESSQLDFKVFDSTQCIPGWTDEEREELDYLIRKYPVEVYEGQTKREKYIIEVYTSNGIDYYTADRDGGHLSQGEPHKNYITTVNGLEEKEYNWERLPVIPFKYNDECKTLLSCCKSLQDAINKIDSIFLDTFCEDKRNTVVVVTNYGGEDPKRIRNQMMKYGIIPIENTDDAPGGGIDTISIDVNSQNYQVVREILKKSIIENCMGYDAKDDKLSGTPNQMNIQSMYNDIDLDANGMETEFQSSLEMLMWFVNVFLRITGKGDYSQVPYDFIFDRDMMMNENDIINNCKNSAGIISNKTIISNHPYVTDVQQELDQIKREKEEEAQMYPDRLVDGDLDEE